MGNVPVFNPTTESTHMADTETGTVKWFNESKGYGFITPSNGGKDLFAHIKETQDGAPLSEGQQVQFVVTQGQKGPQASSIRGV